MEALAIRASAKKHANVLDHMMGYFSERLSAAERCELVELIRDYREATGAADRAGHVDPTLRQEIRRRPI